MLIHTWIEEKESVYFPSCNSHTMSMLTLRRMSELQIDISINVNQMYYCWGLERVRLTWNCKKGRMKNESTSLHSVYFAPCCSYIMSMLRLRRTSELWLDLSMNVNHTYYCWGLERVLSTWNCRKEKMNPRHKERIKVGWMPQLVF